MSQDLLKLTKDELLFHVVDRYERANFTINRRLNSRIKELLPADITLDQLSVLRYLARNHEVTSTELADIFCVGKSTITATITRMVDKGLIDRIPSQEDRRVIYLHISELGKQKFSIIQAKLTELLKPYLEIFEASEAVQLINALENLANVLHTDTNVKA